MGAKSNSKEARDSKESGDSPHTPNGTDSKRRHVRLSAGSGMGIWKLDCTINRFFLDAQMYEQCGVESGNCENGYDTLSKFIHPDDFARVEQEINNVKYSPEEMVSDFRIIQPDGTIRLLRAFMRAVRARDGTPLHVVGICQDITDLKQVEEIFQLPEQHYATLLSHLPGMAYRCNNDTDWTMEYVSSGCEALTGYARDDLIYNHRIAYNDLICTDDRDMVWTLVQAALAERRPYQLEYRIRHKSGTEKWVWERGCGQFSDSGELLYLEGFVSDITDRKQVETQLFNRKEQLATTLNSIGDAVIATDTQGRITMMNPVAEQIAGWKKEEMFGVPLSNIFRIINEHTRQPVEDPIERVLTSGNIIDMANEALLTLRDGREIPITDSGAPIRSRKGEITGVVLVFRDQTCERLGRRALEQSEARYRSLFDNMTVGFMLHEVVADEDGRPVDLRIIEANPTAAKTIGIGIDELVGCTSKELMGDLDPFWIETYGRIARTRVAEEFEHYSQKLGRHLLIRAFSPEENQVAVLFMDITEQKETELKLRFLSTAIEQSPELVVITDTDGHIQYVNQAFEQVTGYSKDEVLGKRPDILKSGVQDKSFYTQLWNTIRAGNVWTGRFVNRRKDGSLYTEEARISPVKDPSGNITHFVQIKRDITKELIQEEELRHSQKMEAVGQLAGGVAHDFNNLLQAILGFSQLLKASLPVDSMERENAEEIIIATRKASKLTAQLLAFSRKQSVHMAQMDLNAAIRDTEALIQALLGDDIELVMDLYEHLHPIHADYGQMKQVVMNMVVNAREAMANDGRLTIATGNLMLGPKDLASNAGLQPGAYVCLSITDTGCGMAREVKERIFEPFFTTKDISHGSGLGLSVVYGIIQQAKGWINVYSEVNLGSCFNIYLPAATPKIAYETRKKIDHSTFGKRILLVEDDTDVGHMVVEILNNANYKVVHASNAEEALALYSTEGGHFDLVISDMVLPGMDGGVFANAIRDQHPSLPILLYSGYRDLRQRWEHIKHKDYFFTTKPFTVVGLLSTIKNILSEHN